MGFFSSIWKAIKSIIRSVLNSVAKLFNKVFGSPVVAALAMFIVAWCIFGPAEALWQNLWRNPWLYLTQSPILMAAAVNVVITILSELIPSFAEWMAKIMGFVSFVLLALGAWQFLTTGKLFIDTIWLASKIGSFGLSMETFNVFFQVLVWYNTISFATGLSYGPDSQFIKGWIDGFSAVPDVVVEVVDSTVDGVLSAVADLFIDILPYLGLGLLAYKLIGADNVKLVMPGTASADQRSVSGKEEPNGETAVVRPM